MSKEPVDSSTYIVTILLHDFSYNVNAAPANTQHGKISERYNIAANELYTSTEPGREPAVAVAVVADAASEEVSREPELAAAAGRLVTEKAAKLATPSAVEESERFLAYAAAYGATARETEGTGTL